MELRRACWLLTMISAAAFCQAPGRDQEAPRLVLPVLDARQQGLAADKDDPRKDKAADLLMEVFDDTTVAAAEAMALLLGFDLSVDCNQALLFEVKVRGKVILPYLARYGDGPAQVAGKQYPPAMLLSADQRKRRYEEAIEAIRTGKIPVLDRKVARLLVPILDAHVAWDQWLKGTEWFKPENGHTAELRERTDDALYSLFADNSAAADEASIVLMDYYIGEHSAHEFGDDLSRRGKRLLPYLPKHRDQYFVIPGRKYAYRTWFNFEGRKSGRDYIIEALEREENPWVIASEEALERVLQILNARGAVLDPKETKGSPHQDGRLLNALFDDTTCDGTNTLAILLAFDLGEANGQALLHELRVRETHTWPSSSELEQYQFGPPSMLGGQYPPELLLPADQIKQRYRAALDLMQSGKLPLLDSKVVDLAASILDARRQFGETAPGSGWMERLLSELSANQSAVADETLVVLAGYSLGEPASQIRDDLIRARGKRMLPLLRKHRDEHYSSPYPHWMRHAPEARRELLDMHIAALNPAAR